MTRLSCRCTNPKLCNLYVCIESNSTGFGDVTTCWNGGFRCSGDESTRSHCGARPRNRDLCPFRHDTNSKRSRTWFWRNYRKKRQSLHRCHRRTRRSRQGNELPRSNSIQPGFGSPTCRKIHLRSLATPPCKSNPPHDKTTNRPLQPEVEEPAPDKR